MTGISALRISLAERGFAVLRKRGCEAIAESLKMLVESIGFDQITSGKAEENQTDEK